MTRFELEKYEQLVGRILAGEVVFFVGAGFSLDSEGNTAQRLIARLLARFTAVTEYLSTKSVPLEDLRVGLRRTFKLKEQENIVAEEVVTRLADRYYDINDWIISAFETLVGALDRLPDADAAVKNEINACENKLLRACPLKSTIDTVELSPIPIDLLRKLPAHSQGKALFLETMGFFDRSIMTGDPSNGDLQTVMSNYRGILRDRHRVLARLAREGLCPLLLTTNYDLLLEGACRLAGFEVPPFGHDQPAAEERLKPPATFDQLYRIGAPTDFFDRGAAFRSALLVKIHGCADRYRLERSVPQQWSNYLTSIVFTYREIQNWRKDSWSRDLVATLLRTRTMVLCGYSGADPVLHDTFRTVYEEIGSQHGAELRANVPTDKVRAYFTGAAVSREFHGLEILRAASRAAGADSPPLTDHQNYLPFYFQNEKKFPSLDECMTWILHRTMRGLQKQALRTDLRRTASQLLRRPVPEPDLEAVRTHFKSLEEAEQKLAEKWSDEGSSHWEFGRVAGWTDRFHTALLREFALGEAVQRNQGPGLRTEHLRSARCYFPISDQPGWAAWGVVLEIALRRMLAATRETPAPWSADHRWVEPAICEYPALLFSQSDVKPSPACLLLRFAGFERPRYRPEIRGVYRRLKIWELTPGIERRSADAAPLAQHLWRWAVAAQDYKWQPKELADARRWLGDS
jgi:SIR2-like protein